MNQRSNEESSLIGKDIVQIMTEDMLLQIMKTIPFLS
jgi:hypothetical protein